MPQGDDQSGYGTPQEKRTMIQKIVRIRCAAVQKTLDDLLSMVGKKSGFGPLQRVITYSKKLISFHVEWQKKKNSKGVTQYLNRDTDNTQYDKPVPDAAKYKINVRSVNNTQIFQQADNVDKSLEDMLLVFYSTGEYNELTEMLKRCRTLIKLYVEWEEIIDPNDRTTKKYYNRKLMTVHQDAPLPGGWSKKNGQYVDEKGRIQTERPKFSQSRLALKFMPRIDEVYEACGINTDRCLQNDTSSEVQFLLRISEVNDAQEVLHAMRLLLA